MHFSLPLSISLILLPLLQHVSFAAAAPEAIPAPPRLRISLPQFSSGAAVIISTDGTTRAYYQDGDGGLHEVSGPFFVDENVFFDDDLILAAGGARKDTPLAVVDLTGTGFLVSFLPLFLFFSSFVPDKFVNGNQLIDLENSASIT